MILTACCQYHCFASCVSCHVTQQKTTAERVFCIKCQVSVDICFFVTCLIFAMHHCASLMYAIAISSCHMVVLILDTVDDIGWDRMSLSVIGFVLHNVF